MEARTPDKPSRQAQHTPHLGWIEDEAHKKSLADMASSEKRQSGGQVETDFRVKKVKKKEEQGEAGCKKPGKRTGNRGDENPALAVACRGSGGVSRKRR